MLQRDAWAKLSLVPGLGARSLLRLLQAFASPEAVLEASANALASFIKPDVVARLRQIAEQPLPSLVQDWLAEPGNHLLAWGDANYPPALLQTVDPPPVLYAKGQLECLARPALAIVGSRKASVPGERHARLFAEALAARGIVVVSGLATGIDAAAHVGGLAGAGSSIAVVATGLDRVYPAAHRDLAHRLAREGLLLSEFPLGTAPLAGNFPRRNRIIAGLAQGVLVVEAALRSGSLITARYAADAGREVFAIPGSIDSPLAQGCHQLIRQGAKLVERIEDIVEELGWEAAGAAPLSGLPDKDLPEWLLRLGYEPFDVDQAVAVSGLTASEVCAILLTQELDGLLAALPGGRYQRLAPTKQ